ncbi:hypothetical protein DRJ86_15005, partial [Enterococcus faecalis]
NEQIAGMSIMEVIMKMTTIFSTDKTEDAAIIFDEAKGLYGRREKGSLHLGKNKLFRLCGEFSYSFSTKPE